jgi:hypothetical protein
VVFDHHTGANLAGAAGVATGPGKARRELSTDAGGRVRLTPIVPGAWTLAVRTPGYVARTLAVTVPAGDRPAQVTAPDLRLELERGAIVAGTVRDRAGDRVAGAARPWIRRGDARGHGHHRRLGEFRCATSRPAPSRVTGDQGDPAHRHSPPSSCGPGDERGGVELMVVAP